MSRFKRGNNGNGVNPGTDEEERKTKPAKTGEKQAGNQGQFKPGISGNSQDRPEGSRNKATLAVQALMDGEAESQTRKIVKLAKGGDIDALKFCLSRLIPPRKDRVVALRLPKIEAPTDLPKAFASLLRAIGEGELTPTEGRALGAMIESCRAGDDGLSLRSDDFRLKSSLPSPVTGRRIYWRSGAWHG